MDSTAHISQLIDQLDENLDNLQDALKSILNKSLTDVAAGYPMLDRAKFYILITYAIESAIFSFLRLTGTSAREHPVYRELERVKQYFQKAKLAEVTVQKPAMRLDQAAAGRFIKAALAGNESLPTRQNGSARSDTVNGAKDLSVSDSDNSRKRKATAMEEEPSSLSAAAKPGKDSAGAGHENSAAKPAETTGAPTSRFVAQSTTVPESTSNSAEASDAAEVEAPKAESKKAAKARRKEKKRAKKEAEAARSAVTNESTDTASPPKKKQKKHKNKASKDKP